MVQGACAGRGHGRGREIGRRGASHTHHEEGVHLGDDGLLVVEVSLVLHHTPQGTLECVLRGGLLLLSTARRSLFLADSLSSLAAFAGVSSDRGFLVPFSVQPQTLPKVGPETGRK